MSDYRFSHRVTKVNEEDECLMLVQTLRSGNIGYNEASRRRNHIMAKFHSEDINAMYRRKRISNDCIPTIEEMEYVLENYQGMLERKKTFGQMEDAFSNKVNELQATGLQLQVRDEQLQVRDEQLQAKDEQLLTKDEELQSKNEQLQANNEQIQAKDEQLLAKDFLIKVLVIILFLLILSHLVF